MEFESLWSRHDDFQLPEKKRRTCAFAEQFSKWAEDLCKSSKDQSIVSVNQAKLLLTDKYFSWKSVVPKSHRERIGQNGHECIFHVFEKAYERLRVIELSLTPPMLFLPPALPPSPAPPPPSQLAGIFLGEIEKA